MKKILIGGVVLFLLGLLNGMVVPYFENPRMGLASHLAGVQNALVLIAFGLIWKYVTLQPKAKAFCTGLSIFSMYSIWLSLVLAAIWGTSSATPIAGLGFSGSDLQELMVNILLYSGSIAIVVATCQVLFGLLKNQDFVE